MSPRRVARAAVLRDRVVGMTRGSGGGIDHFPSTHATWIVGQLSVLTGGAGSDPEAVAQAAQELRTHIMARYREPLLAYATASSFRFLGSPVLLAFVCWRLRLRVSMFGFWTPQVQEDMLS